MRFMLWQVQPTPARQQEAQFNPVCAQAYALEPEIDSTAKCLSPGWAATFRQKARRSAYRQNVLARSYYGRTGHNLCMLAGRVAGRVG